jgi:hypothetical protein
MMKKMGTKKIYFRGCGFGNTKLGLTDMQEKCSLLREYCKKILLANLLSCQYQD